MEKLWRLFRNNFEAIQSNGAIYNNNEPKRPTKLEICSIKVVKFESDRDKDSFTFKSESDLTSYVTIPTFSISRSNL